MFCCPPLPFLLHLLSLTFYKSSDSSWHLTSNSGIVGFPFNASVFYYLHGIASPLIPRNFAQFHSVLCNSSQFHAIMRNSTHTRKKIYSEYIFQSPHLHIHTTNFSTTNFINYKFSEYSKVK